MIKCPRCGRSLTSVIQVCPYCGKKLSVRTNKKPTARPDVLQYEEMDDGLVDPNRVNRRSSFLVWLSVLAILACIFLMLVLFANDASAQPFLSACVRMLCTL